MLAAAPPSVRLSFNEPVQITRLQAVKSDGTVIRADHDWPLADNAVWALPAALADGGWLLSYAAISTDSHPISGTIRFVVGQGAVTFGAAPQPGDALTEYPRFLLIGGILAGAGLLFASAAFGIRLGRSANGGPLPSNSGDPGFASVGAHLNPPNEGTNLPTPL